MAKTLSDAAVKKLRPNPTKRREIPDAGVVGLYLIIHPTGKKMWALRTRRPGGQTAKVTLGSVDLTGGDQGEPVLGAPLSLRAARVLATQLLHQRAKGIDVAEQALRKRIDGDLFPDLVADFIADHARPKTRGWRTTARILGLHYPKEGGEPELIAGGLAKRWGTRPMADIDAGALHSVVDAARRTGIPGIKARTSGASDSRGRKMAKALSKLFAWATTHRRVAINPCLGLYKPPEGASRDRVLTAQEIRTLWSACTRLGHPTGNAIKLMLLTGQRRSEIAGMRWSELNDDFTAWTLPAIRTKNGRQHVVPLSRLAQNIVASAPRMAGSDLVFTTVGDRPINGFGKAKRRLDELMKPAAPWALHDARRTCATGLSELGVAVNIVEATLNHISGTRGGIAGVYDRAAHVEAKRAALELWAERVATIVTI